ncbi:MAG: amidohydrolase family protein [Gammaproteobacteria bacterium]
MSFDLVIRGGTLVDGTGLPAFRADIAVNAGRIAAVGRLRAAGREEIDATGKVVCPGFIDGHTHMDAQVMWDALGTNSCWQGVTTVVMGNCGFSLAPARPHERAFVVRNLERAEDISAQAMAAGIDWQWETYPEYLDTVDRRPKAINYAGYVGHSALRTWAMGERAFTEAATDADLAAMAGELDRSLRAGAMGFTTSLSSAHRTSDDRPVASRLANWDEVARLVAVMGEAGAGIFEIAQDNVEAWNAMRPHVVDIALATGVPCMFGVLARPETFREDLRQIDAVTAAGGQLIGQTVCKPTMTIVSFASQLPFDTLPHWRELRALPLEQQQAALRDPALRQRLVQATEHGDYREGVGPEMRRPDFARTLVFDSVLPPHRTVAEVAVERGVHPVEAMIDLALASGMRQLFAQLLSQNDEDCILQAMSHPRTLMTFSDSGAHVSQIADASIHTYLLAYWVRRRQAFSLEHAIRMLTLAPARAFGFHDRGLVREGLAADLIVFDPDRIGPRLPEVVRDLPGGAMRLTQRADGIDATVVGGQVVLRAGEHTGAYPGRLLRGPLAR